MAFASRNKVAVCALTLHLATSLPDPTLGRQLATESTTCLPAPRRGGIAFSSTRNRRERCSIARGEVLLAKDRQTELLEGRFCRIRVARQASLQAEQKPATRRTPSRSRQRARRRAEVATSRRTPKTQVGERTSQARARQRREERRQHKTTHAGYVV